MVVSDRIRCEFRSITDTEPLRRLATSTCRPVGETTMSTGRRIRATGLAADTVVASSTSNTRNERAIGGESNTLGRVS